MDGAPASFAGSWRLSLERSEFGKVPGGPPQERTDVIEHDGPRIRHTLNLVWRGRQTTATYDYSTDGEPTVNRIDGREVRTVAAWEGDVLRLRSSTRLLMFTMALDERWSLSPDAHTLTFQRHVRYGVGEDDQKLVFGRESRTQPDPAGGRGRGR